MYDEDTKTDLIISEEGRTRNSVAYFKPIEILKSQMNENVDKYKYKKVRGFKRF